MFLCSQSGNADLFQFATPKSLLYSRSLSYYCIYESYPETMLNIDQWWGKTKIKSEMILYFIHIPPTGVLTTFIVFAMWKCIEYLVSSIIVYFVIFSPILGTKIGGKWLWTRRAEYTRCGQYGGRCRTRGGRIYGSLLQRGMSRYQTPAMGTNHEK